MTSFFLDTSYLIAIIHKRDGNHHTALEIYRNMASIGKPSFYVSWPVLSEFLGFFSHKGQYLRMAAADAVSSLLLESDVLPIEAGQEDYNEAFKLYASRNDKEFSLVDCHTIISVRKFEISGVVSFDGDFDDEGIVVIRTGKDVLSV